MANQPYNGYESKGWRPPLTPDICFMAELLLYNARAKVCDCDTPCSCLEFYDIVN